MVSNLKIELENRLDSKDQVYFIGRLRFPGTIDCSKGVTFLAFTSEVGEEELQIAVNDNENTTFSRYTKKHDRVKISMEAREDQYGKIYYVGKLQLNGSIKFDQPVVFLLFTSISGHEELQVVCQMAGEKGQKDYSSGREEPRSREDYDDEDNSVEIYPRRIRTVSAG